MLAPVGRFWYLNELGGRVSREETVAIVEAYLRGLAGKDISKVPFATNITFEGPRVGKLIGRNAVIGFLTSILPAVKSVQIKQHIVEGDFVAMVFEMETIFGVDQVCDRVHVRDGELKEIHSFYYPPPNQSTRKSYLNSVAADTRKSGQQV
jgi:hypothetical protein